MELKVLHPYKEKKEKPKADAKKQRPRGKSKPLKEIYKGDMRKTLNVGMEVIEMSTADHLETLFRDYKAYYGRPQTSKDEPKYIKMMMQDFAFASILPKVVEKNYDLVLENGEELSEMLCNASNEINANRGRIGRGREILSIYSNIYEDLNEERIQRVFSLEIPGVEWPAALQLCLVSHGQPKYTMMNTLRTIYRNVRTTDYDLIRKLFIRLYGKEDMAKVATYILLEKKYDRQANHGVDYNLYNLITTIALDELERLPKAEIRRALQEYCNQRRRTEFEKDMPRRVSFSSINKDDYPKINKAVKKLSKKGEVYQVYLNQTRVR